MHDHDGVGEDPVQHEASGFDGTPARAFRLGALIVLPAYSWWAVAQAPFSAAATAAVVFAGLLAALAGTVTVGRSPRRRALHLPGWGMWTVLATIAGLWQLGAYLQHPRDEHPTLSFLLNALLDSQPARAAAFVLWIVGMFRLARR